MRFNNFLFISFLVIVAGCSPSKKPVETPYMASLPTVLIAQPIRHVFQNGLEITGAAKANQSVKIYAIEPGFIEKINVDIGKHVRHGEIIAVLENPDLQQQYAQAEADLKLQKALYERQKSLNEKNLAPTEDLEKAQASYDVAKAKKESLKAQVDFLLVKAPFTGVITARYQDKGALMASGLNNSAAMPIVEMMEINPIRVEAEIPETEAAALTNSSQAKIIFPALGNSEYSGKVSRTGSSLDPSSKTMKAQIDLSNSHEAIRPGMYAKIHFNFGRKDSILSVPNSSIGSSKGQSFVYKVASGKVSKIIVQLGLRDEKYSEILGSDLQPTDSVIVQGKDLVSDGMDVNAKSQP